MAHGLATAPARERRRRAEGGFSLVELMVVISIIGLLSAIVAVNVLKSGHKAKVQAVKSAVKAFEDAITMFHNDTGKYPGALDELVASSGPRGFDGPYIKGGMKALRDPWKNEYVYQYTGSGDPPYDIGSYGADGQASGEGENADIFPLRDEE